MSGRCPRAIRGVIFDLDGTLTVPVLDFAAIRAEIGVAEGQMILEYLDGLAEAERRHGEAILERHEQEAAARSELSAGARELLDFLAEAGIKTGVVTRNSRESVETFCERHGVRFDAVVTRTDAPPKPSPVPLLVAAEQMGVGMNEVIYVGDFEIDRLTGEAAGVVTYIVQNHPEPRDSAEPERRLRTLRELVDVVREANCGCGGTAG